MSKRIVCHCGFTCSSSRALSSHWEHNPGCAAIETPPRKKHKTIDTSTTSSIKIQDSNIQTNTNDDNNFDIDNDTDNYVNFIDPQEQNRVLQLDINPQIKKNIKAKIELIKLLTKAKAPMYLFDNILTWARNAVNNYDVDFGTDLILTRNRLMQELKSKYHLDHLDQKNM